MDVLEMGRAWWEEKGLRTPPSVISREAFHPNFPDTCLADVTLLSFSVYECVCVCGGGRWGWVLVLTNMQTHTHTHTHTHTLTLLCPVAPSASSHMQCGYIGDLCKPCPLPNMLFLQLVAWVVLSPETSAQMSPLRRSPP